MAESEYLKGTVGDALRKGCAATVVADPPDPIEYLALWLKRCAGPEQRYMEHSGLRVPDWHVQNKGIVQQYEEGKAQKRQNEQAWNEKAEGEERQRLQEQNARKEALSAIEEVASNGDPLEVWDKAVEGIVRHTGAGACYVGAVVQDEEEEAELEEDEQDEDLMEEGTEPEEHDQEQGQSRREEEDDERDQQGQHDYSQSYLRYLVGDSSIVGLELHRPQPPEDDPDAEPPTEGQGVTLRLLDEEGLQTIEVPNVLDEPRIRYFKRMPKAGAYYALPTKLASGEIVGILCLDTCPPSGRGTPLRHDERWFAIEVARMAEKGLEAVEGTKRTVRDEAEQARKSLRDALTHLEAPAKSESGEEAKEESEQEQGGATPRQQQEEPPNEGEEVDESETTKERKEAASALEASESKLQEAQSKLDHCQKRLGVAREHLQSLIGRASMDARIYVNRPPRLSYKVFKAALRLCGHQASDFATWSRARQFITPDTLSRVAALDPLDPQTLDSQVMADVRRFLKGIREHHLIGETVVGAVLRRFITELRKTAQAAEEKRAQEQDSDQKKEEYNEKMRAEQEEERQRQEREQAELQQEQEEQQDDGEPKEDEEEAGDDEEGEDE